jgi:hypothetical protein
MYSSLRVRKNLVRDSMDVSDIEGTQTMPLIPISSSSYVKEEIPGSKPEQKGYFLKTKRIVNPLEPVYPLSRVEDRPDTPPSRPPRAVLDVSDIEGTSPKPMFKAAYTRDTYTVDDIEGTKPGWRPPHQKRTTPGMLMDVKDINTGGIFVSKRVTDPLSPRYEYDMPKEGESVGESVGAERASITAPIGEIPGSHPVERHHARSGPHYALETKDVTEDVAAKEHHLPPTFPSSEKRRQWREINKTEDIEGCKARLYQPTFKVQSKRQTNPLDPQYEGLESAEDRKMMEILGTLPKESRREKSREEEGRVMESKEPQGTKVSSRGSAIKLPIASSSKGSSRASSRTSVRERREAEQVRDDIESVRSLPQQ